MALSTVSSGTSADASDLNQVVEALIGTAGAGQPISMVALNDATNFALDVRNQDTTNGRAFRVRDSSNSARFQVTSSGPEADPSGAGTLSRLVTETGSATLTNKTFSNSTFGSGIVGMKMNLVGDTLLTSTAASITFSAIASSFASLYMHVLARTDTAVGIDTLQVQFNNDTAANYHSQINRSSATVSTGVPAIASTAQAIGLSVGSSASTTSNSGLNSITIPYYASTNRKAAVYQALALGSTALGLIRQDNGAALWDSTVAISTITLFAASAGFAAGTRATLWGLST